MSVHNAVVVPNVNECPRLQQDTSLGLAFLFMFQIAITSSTQVRFSPDPTTHKIDSRAHLYQWIIAHTISFMYFETGS
jgi:hypothetical protein